MARSATGNKARRGGIWVVVPTIMGGLILLLLMASVVQGNQHQVKNARENIIDPDLAETLREAESDEKFNILVYLNDSVDLTAQTFPENEIERRRAIVEELRRSSISSQSSLLQAIEQFELENHAELERTFWIVNAIQLRANKVTILSLASRSDIERISSNSSYQLLDPQQQTLNVISTGLNWGIERVRARHVWEGLGIDGSGVTVAFMDTGVDWLHPILRDSYRGHVTNGPAIHEGNWYDVVEGTGAPQDPNGHGTHVAGTAVGSSGFGVAPGANWIGVRILNESGFGTIGDIHAGFQWLLAPAGNPALAPDLVNNSWSAQPGFTDFLRDVEVLRAAGIITMFAAGNRGPEEASVGSPADYPNTIAVSAVDESNTLAWFSAKGPSQLTADLKPTFTAPGTHILSSLPDSSYGFYNGTSMATPHAVGSFALLLSAEPSLSEKELTHIVTSTAKLYPGQSVGTEYGWGLIDAYGAVASVVDSGSMNVTVHLDGQPHDNIPVQVENNLGVSLTFHTEDDGTFNAKLLPGSYEISAKKFGYSSIISKEVTIIEDQVSIVDLSLEKLPFGKISGQLQSSQNPVRITGLLSLLDTPIVVESDIDGYFELEAPVGEYELMASATGYSIGREAVTINAGNTWRQDFLLDPISRTLLVDSGAWYYDSQIDYLQNALLANDYSFDLLTIRNPFTDRPTLEDLKRYELVFWSAPGDSPGAIGSGDVLANYLEEGGNLWISGQDVAFLDSTRIFSEPWWHSQLKGIFLEEAVEPFNIDGDPSSFFAGLRLELNGNDSAQNQFHPDKSVPRKNTLTAPTFYYDDGLPAGLQISDCEPYRILFFGFGLEGVSGFDVRKDIVNRSLDYFEEPETIVGVNITPQEIEDLVPQGSQQTFQLKIHNLSEIYTDTITLSVEGAQWPVQLSAEDIELGPCHSSVISFTVSVPLEQPINTFENFDVLIGSSIDQSFNERVPVSLKTPNHILLVDDDRWYDQSDTFKTALDLAGFEYDYWDIGHSSEGKGSPSLELLQAYPIVIWYTGYDWFEPITEAEGENIYRYLSDGGRLYLSSQDYLYYHLKDRLTTDYFNIDGYYETLEPTLLFANPEAGFMDSLAGPISLNFGLYQNFSDGLLPKAGIEVSIWNDQGLPGGVQAAGQDWRNIFWALPFEVLPLDRHPSVMNTIVGWLGDLGESSFIVDKRSNSNAFDLSRTYTLTVSNLAGNQTNLSTVTNTLPLELTIDVSSIKGNATYDSSSRQLTWQGFLNPGQEQVISYRAEIDDQLPSGHQIENLVELHYEKHDIAHRLSAATWFNASDLSASNIIVSPTTAAPGSFVTVTAFLHNSGATGAIASSTLFFLDKLEPITETVQLHAGSISFLDDRLVWGAQVNSQETVTATLRLKSDNLLQLQSFPLLMTIEEAGMPAIVKWADLEIKPFERFFPWMVANTD